MKRSLLCMALVASLAGVGVAGGSYKKPGPRGPQGPKGDRGDVGPKGDTGPAGPNHGLHIGLGGGLRHQEKWFDVDALAYKDVRHGGVTALGLVLLKPGKSWQERENEKLRDELESLKSQIAAIAGRPAGDVREINIRGNQ